MFERDEIDNLPSTSLKVKKLIDDLVNEVGIGNELTDLTNEEEE